MPPTILAKNPTTPHILQYKPQTHQQKMRANTPGGLPTIHCSHLIPPILAPAPSVPIAKQIQVGKKRAQQMKLSTYDKMPRRSTRLQLLPPMFLQRLCNKQIISQEAINNLIMDDLIYDMTSITPMNLHPPPSPPINYEHYTMPIIHPMTRELISSYTCLMNDYDTVEVWMTAFGKDFGGMSQGYNRTGQIGHVPTRHI